MQRTLLKSKIHRATVRDADLHYEGSITIDEDLLDAADIVVHEQVDVYDIANGARLTRTPSLARADREKSASTGRPPT